MSLLTQVNRRASLGHVPKVVALPSADNSAAQPAFKFNITANLRAAAVVHRVVEGTAREVLNVLAAPVVASEKSAVALFSIGVLREGLNAGESVSETAALSGVHSVVLDLDDISQAQVEHAAAALKNAGFLYLMHPTFTWSAEKPKWRVVVPLSSVQAVSRLGELWAGLGRIAGQAGDVAARKPAQRYFLHSHPPGALGRPAAVVAGNRLATPADLLGLGGEAAEDTGVATRPTYDLSINEDVIGPALADNRSRDCGLIAANCGFIGAFSKGDPLSESEWRAAAGVLHYCQNGEKQFHNWSAKDSRYEHAEAQKKWDGWTAAGPAKCGAWSGCNACPHMGKIGSPVLLGELASPTTPKLAAEGEGVLRTVLAGGGLESFMDTDGQLNFIMLSDVGGRAVRTVMNADSVAASDAILALAAASGKVPTDRAVDLYKASLRFEARRSGETTEVFLRVADLDGVIYVDLGPGRIQRISADGLTLLDDAAAGVPLFRRGAGVGQLPNPEEFKTADAALSYLLKFLIAQFGLSADQALAIAVTLCEWHRTGTPHPILELVGPAGSGKSMLGDFVLACVDPAGDGGRLTVGTSGPDIAAAAQQRYVLPLDNAGRLDKTTSDILCVVSTGGTLLVRLLYTTGETASLKLHRPLIVTAVSPVCTAPDLQTRVFRIELAGRTTGYTAEGQLRAIWGAEKARISGAIYCLLAGALRELPAVRMDANWGHRLVDTDQMGEAIARSCGLKPGRFIAAAGRLRESMIRRSAAGDPFMIGLLGVLRELALKPTHSEQLSLHAVLQLKPAVAVVAYDGRIEITARPSAIHSLCSIHSSSYLRDNLIPRTPRGLADAVRRVHPMLTGLGVAVHEVGSGTRSLLRFDFERAALDE